MSRGFVEESVADALERALVNATHLRAKHAAAVAAARTLARKIDSWDVIVQWAVEDAAAFGSRPAVPANDNVSLASFLKYLEKLELLPDEIPAGAVAKPPVQRNDLAAFRARQGAG